MPRPPNAGYGPASGNLPLERSASFLWGGGGGGGSFGACWPGISAAKGAGPPKGFRGGCLGPFVGQRYRKPVTTDVSKGF